MSVVGEMLRNMRQARRISLNQASLETRIRQSVLEALEEGEYAALPPRPFLRGLIRNYALYLNLDPDTLLDEYNAETQSRHRPPPEPPAPEPLPPSFPPREQADPFDTHHTEPPEVYTFPAFQIPSSPRTNGAAEPEPSGVGTVFQVAPELEPQVPAAFAPLDIPTETPTIAARIGRTRAPEIVAVLAIIVVIVGLVTVGFTALQNFRNPLTTAATPRATIEPSATIRPGSTPTPIPTIGAALAADTPGAGATDGVVVVSNTVPTGVFTAPTLPPASPTLNIPADAQMTFSVEATGEMFVWVLADNQEVFNGRLENDARTWTAHARLFAEVKNLINGQVTFNEKRILARNQIERSDLYRAWEMNSKGTPVPVEPTPYPATIAPTETPTFTPTDTVTPSRTPTRTPTNSRTPTFTATPTLTASSTPTPTNTFTATPTRTPTNSRTPTQTPSVTPTHTPSPTSGFPTFTPIPTITPPPTPNPLPGAASATPTTII